MNIGRWYKLFNCDDFVGLVMRYSEVGSLALHVPRYWSGYLNNRSAIVIYRSRASRSYLNHDRFNHRKIIALNFQMYYCVMDLWFSEHVVIFCNK